MRRRFPFSENFHQKTSLLDSEIFDFSQFQRDHLPRLITRILESTLDSLYAIHNITLSGVLISGCGTPPVAAVLHDERDAVCLVE